MDFESLARKVQERQQEIVRELTPLDTWDRGYALGYQAAIDEFRKTWWALRTYER